MQLNCSKKGFALASGKKKFYWKGLGTDCMGRLGSLLYCRSTMKMSIRNDKDIADFFGQPGWTRWLPEVPFRSVLLWLIAKDAEYGLSNLHWHSLRIKRLDKQFVIFIFSIHTVQPNLQSIFLPYVIQRKYFKKFTNNYTKYIEVPIFPL